MGASKAVNLELVWLGKASLGQPLANVLTLVTLQLENLTVLWMLHHRSVASKLLHKKYTIQKNSLASHVRKGAGVPSCSGELFSSGRTLQRVPAQ